MKLYNSIVNFLSNIETDKYLHFIVCLSILLISTNIMKSLIIGFVVTMLIGVLKETFDKYVQKERFDMDDIKADFIGALYGSILWLIIV